MFVTGEEAPPNLIGPDAWIGHGVDSGGRRFWFPSSNPNKYPWDLRGRYDIRDGVIHITELSIRPNPDAAQPIVGLDADLIRRFTQLTPIKRAIREQEQVDREKIEEARAQLAAEDRTNPAIERWAKLIESSWEGPGKQTRHSPESWAQWTLDYLHRVEEKGTAYGVQLDIAEERSWGVSYHTVRDRIKTMRRLGWIRGEGRLVTAGPLLAPYLPRVPRINETQPPPHGTPASRPDDRFHR